MAMTDLLQGMFIVLMIATWALLLAEGIVMSATPPHDRRRSHKR
jgi:hypothetical protein